MAARLTVTKSGSTLRKLREENWVNCGKPTVLKHYGNPQPSPRKLLGKVQRLSAQCLQRGDAPRQ